MKVVIAPAKSTETKFGLVQDDGFIEVVGSCCGTNLLYTSGSGNFEIQCQICEKLFTNVLSDDGGARSTIFYLTGVEAELKEWVAHWTGWKYSDIEVSIGGKIW